MSYEKITSLLEEFTLLNGRGSHSKANDVMAQIIKNIVDDMYQNQNKTTVQKPALISVSMGDEPILDVPTGAVSPQEAVKNYYEKKIANEKTVDDLAYFESKFTRETDPEAKQKIEKTIAVLKEADKISALAQLKEEIKKKSLPADAGMTKDGVPKKKSGPKPKNPPAV